jgi:hypothetical protein
MVRPVGLKRLVSAEEILRVVHAVIHFVACSTRAFLRR